MIQFTAKELADFIEVIRSQAKKEMEPVESKIEVGESKKPIYQYNDENKGQYLDFSQWEMDGMIKYPPNSSLMEPKLFASKPDNNMGDEEIEKAYGRDIESLKMANEGERKSLEYWKDRCEGLEKDLKGSRDLVDYLNKIIQDLPSGEYNFDDEEGWVGLKPKHPENSDMLYYKADRIIALVNLTQAVNSK